MSQFQRQLCSPPWVSKSPQCSQKLVSKSPQYRQKAVIVKCCLPFRFPTFNTKMEIYLKRNKASCKNIKTSFTWYRMRVVTTSSLVSLRSYYIYSHHFFYDKYKSHTRLESIQFDIMTLLIRYSVNEVLQYICFPAVEFVIVLTSFFHH